MHVLPLHLYSRMFSTTKNYPSRTTLLHTSFVKVTFRCKEGRWRYSSSDSQPSTSTWVVSTTLRPFYPRQRLVPPADEDRWASGPVWAVQKFSPGLDSRTDPFRVALPTALPRVPNYSCTTQFRAPCWRLDFKRFLKLEIKVVYFTLNFEGSCKSQ